jgi:hypothetical protein
MENAEAEFWSILYNSQQSETAGQVETLAYCRGTLAFAMDLIKEERFTEANRKLRDLNYYIDCVPFNSELEGIYDTVWNLLAMIDEPADLDTDATYRCNIPWPHLQEPRDN